MKLSDMSATGANLFALRVGCELVYEAAAPTTVLLAFTPAPSSARVELHEQTVFGNGMPVHRATDTHGNTIYRTTLVQGRNLYRHDALYMLPDVPDNQGVPHEPCALGQLPLDVLRYTLPSRYCESDKLSGFAQAQFGCLQGDAERAQAVCDWTHTHLGYRYGSGNDHLSAAEVMQRGYGVCRDFAHVMVALCRAIDLPARYVAGYMPFHGQAEGDIGVDFHAWCEVYVNGHWRTYDARYNKAHVGRIRVAHGMDAVDTAIATMYGDVACTGLRVWAYRTDATREHLGMPVALARTDAGSAVMQA